MRSVYIGLGFVAVAALLWLTYSPSASPRVIAQDDDCKVSECGPDGVPLSRYAG